MPIALSTRVPQLLAVSATFGLLATVVWASHESTQIIAEQPLPLVLEEAAMPVKITEAVAVRQPAPPPAPSNQLLFVFQLGGDRYLKISDDAPAHGKRTLVDGSSTVAAVTNVPAKFRDWSTKSFAVDGGCTATVKSFAVVTRMEGSPGYAGLDDENWTVSTAAAAGTSQFAAKLDLQGCDKALYARDASLAPINELEKLDRPELVEQALAALGTTAAADQAQTAWDEPNAGSEQNTGSWLEHAAVSSFTRRHPTTGQVFVGLHANIRDMGCGGPDVNVWALFRVGRDGKLVTVHATKLDSLYSIEKMIDVDNDGTLELVGRDWLGLATVLTRANGEMISNLPTQFHGCPC